MKSLIIFISALLSTVCGVYIHTAKFKSIIGGTPAEQGKFPYLADIGIIENGVTTWCGGGVLASVQWVLTSSSCLSQIWVGDKKVVIFLGSTNRASNEFGTLRFEISPNSTNIIFNTGSADANDELVLIQLPNRINWTKYIQPVSLPGTRDCYGLLFKEKALAIGWSNDTSSVLNYLELTTMKSTKCVEEYDPERRDIIAPKNICAKLEMKSDQTCFAGVGAPLVTQEYKVLMGLTSTLSLNNCEKPGTPVIFLRITEYLDWIKTIADV
ncbi:hypothetical protein ACFFRR_010238 [Megaselia abdita]